jgi:C-terminal processing protease CtpA/Prc
MLPSWKAMTADGTPTEGVGIVPDLEVTPLAADLKTHDTIIDAAIEALHKKAPR